MMVIVRIYAIKLFLIEVCGTRLSYFDQCEALYKDRKAPLSFFAPREHNFILRVN